MFESQLQTAQFAYGGSVLSTAVAILVLMYGPVPVGVFFIVAASATAAVGGWFYADLRGYPPVLGMGLGIAFGVAGAIFLMLLPDRADDKAAEEAARLDEERRERKRRSKNFEVLDDDDD